MALILFLDAESAVLLSSGLFVTQSPPGINRVVKQCNASGTHGNYSFTVSERNRTQDLLIVNPVVCRKKLDNTQEVAVV